MRRGLEGRRRLHSTEEADGFISLLPLFVLVRLSLLGAQDSTGHFPNGLRLLGLRLAAAHTDDDDILKREREEREREEEKNRSVKTLNLWRIEVLRTCPNV